MDIRQITGSGGVERTPERTARSDRQKAAEDLRTAQAPDAATISADGRETLAAVDALTEKLKNGDQERKRAVAEAKGRLEAGKLDNLGVYRSVAQRLLQIGF